MDYTSQIKVSENVVINRKAPILVEFEYIPGVKYVAFNPGSLEDQSAKAIECAMNTIYNTAFRISSTINALEVQPSQIEVNFGIKLVAETGAIIAKASGEAAFNIKLIWDRK
jgi:hypothetical protein